MTTSEPVVLADIKAEVPHFNLSATSKPTETQVNGYIFNITAEVRALLQACGAVWPADPLSDAATYLKQTIIEGVLEKVFRARFSETRSGMQPEEVTNARNAYLDRKKNICAVARGVQISEEPEEAGQSWPVLTSVPNAPMISGSFAEFTEAVDYWNRRLNGPGPFRIP